MKRIVIFFVALFITFGLAVSQASAVIVEGTVKDVNGNVLIEDPTDNDIPELVRILVKGGGTEASFAQDMLIQFGSKAVPAVVGALAKDNIDAYYRVLYVLWNIKDERSVAPIAKFINDPSWDVANAARGALRAVGDVSVPVVAGLLKEPDYHDAAVDVLVSITPSDKSLDTVRALIASNNALDRAGAAYLLGRWHDKKSGTAIAGLFGDKEPVVREAAIEGYHQLYLDDPSGYDASALGGLLGDPSPKVRVAAANTIAKVPGGAATEPLLERLKVETDLTVLPDVVSRLGETGDPRAVFPIMKIVQRKDVDQKLLVNAIYALGALKAEEAIPYYNQILNDKSGEAVPVQKEIFRSITTIGKKVDMDPYLKYMTYGDNHVTSTPELLKMIDELGRPGDREVISALKKFRDGLTVEQDRRYVNRILDKLE